MIASYLINWGCNTFFARTRLVYERDEHFKLERYCLWQCWCWHQCKRALTATCTVSAEAWWCRGNTFASHHYSPGSTPAACDVFHPWQPCLVSLGFSPTLRRAPVPIGTISLTGLARTVALLEYSFDSCRIRKDLMAIDYMESALCLYTLSCCFEISVDLFIYLFIAVFLFV